MELQIIPVNKQVSNDLIINTPSFGKVQFIQKAQQLFVYLGVGTDKLAAEDIRLLGGFLSKELVKLGKGKAVIDLTLIEKHAEQIDGNDVMEYFLEGWHMANYQFNKYRSKSKKGQQIKLNINNDAFTTCNTKALNTANAVHFARDLCNEPSNHLTPAIYADRLREVFDGTDVKVEVIEDEALSKTEFAGIHTVAKGSDQPPKLVVLTLKRHPRSEPIALIGKGVTFDSGGINAKSGRDISDMKMDMGGSAAVAGAMKLLADSDSVVNVTAILPLVQNISDGNAMLPSDIITYRNGLNVEVGNTDAEGRLILADGILYAQTLGINKIIDIATLTGSIMRALGEKAAGIFSLDESALWHYKQLGDKCGDFVWPMPIYEEYKAYLKTDVADINNMAYSPLGGSITAALFLKQFIKDTKEWIHIDMAGTMKPRKVESYYTPGASGYGVRLLFELIQSQGN